MTRTLTDELRILTATMQAEHPDKADAIGRAHAAIIEGHVIDNQDGTGRVRSRTGETWYTVNSHCECKASEFQRPCRHLSAWKLYKHVVKLVQAQTPPEAAYDAPEAPTACQAPEETSQAPQATDALLAPQTRMLHEAPCSANVRVVIHRKEVLITVRGYTLDEVLPQIEAVIQRYAGGAV